MLRLLLLLAVLVPAHLRADIDARFESPEHAIAGDEVLLFLGKDRTAIKGELLHLPNGLALSFGDLIAMGDFYGIVGSPISEGRTLAEREARFLADFNTLATDSQAVSEAAQIVAMIRQQKQLVFDEIRKGRLPEDIYKEIRDAFNIQSNCLTGGACSGAFWWLTPGRYLRLAEKDYDHFGGDAIKAYVAGHKQAIQRAAEGNLELAYAMDAFACHFLTDRFSSGHLRIPRTELPESVTPAVVGSLLVMYMHNEEAAAGLHVHNKRGEHWVAYGDGHYLSEPNKENQVLMQEAIQLSADEVYEAFLKRQVVPGNQPLMLAPIADEQGPHGKLDVAPMFYWDNAAQKMMRRVDLSDSSDRRWTSFWMGWSTLAELKSGI